MKATTTITVSLLFYVFHSLSFHLLSFSMSLYLSFSFSVCVSCSIDNNHSPCYPSSPSTRISRSLSRLTLFDIPLSSSLLLPNTVRNLDFNAPMLGVRSMNNLILDLSPANAAGGVPGVPVGGGLASTMLQAYDDENVHNSRLILLLLLVFTNFLPSSLCCLCCCFRFAASAAFVYL